MMRDIKHYFSRSKALWPERWLVIASVQHIDNAPGFVHEPGASVPLSCGPERLRRERLCDARHAIVLCCVLLHLALPRSRQYNEWGTEMNSGFADTSTVMPVFVRVRRSGMDSMFKEFCEGLLNKAPEGTGCRRPGSTGINCDGRPVDLELPAPTAESPGP